MTDSRNLARVRAYLRAIEAGDAAAVFRDFAPDAIQTEWPNRLKPTGDCRGLDQMRRDFDRGRTLLAAQRYEVLGHAASAGTVIVEVRWRGTLAGPVGNLAAGDEMVVHSAIAFDFRDDSIVAQRNYDCFEPF